MRKMATILSALGAIALAVPATVARAQGLPYTFSAGTPARAAEVNANFRYVAPRNVVFVSRHDGGTDADAGAALRSALVLASLTAINGAPSATNRYVVRVAPGVYDVGATALTLPSHVSLIGSGDATDIRGQVAGGAGPFTGLVNMSDATEIAFVSLTNAVPGLTAIAINIASGSARVSDSRLETSGNTVIPVHALGAATLIIEQCRLIAVGGPYAAGVYASSGASVTVLESRIDVATSANGVRGIGIERGVTGSAMTVRDTIVVAFNPNTTGMSEAFGMLVSGTQLADVSGTSITASGGENTFAFVAGVNGRARIRDSSLTVAGSAPNRYPMRTGSGSTTEVMHSRIDGGPVATARLLLGAGGSARIATSMVTSGFYDGTGTVVCVYDYTSLFVATTCELAPF